MTALAPLLLLTLATANDDSSEEAERFDFYEYDDNFARRIMFRISAAAYSNRPFDCLHALGFEGGSHQFSFPCQDGTCSGYVAQLSKYRAIAIGFRGTETTSQLVQQAIDGLISPWSVERVLQSKWDYGGHVSLYYHKVFVVLWSGLQGHVYAYMKEHPDWDIWISGHSLGGALATLAASYLVKSRRVAESNTVKLVTFGQPRVGDKEFANSFDEEELYAYRVVHWHDVVPAILKTGYWHQGKEIFYKAGMRPGESSLCESGDSVYCSNSHLGTSVKDHQTYFGEIVSQYGKKGCKH